MSTMGQPGQASARPALPIPQPAVRRLHLAALTIVAALVQLGLHFTYLPWWCGDSEGYAGAASVLYGSDFTKYLSERTPGYPVFLIACERLTGGRVGWKLRPAAGQVVACAQSILHVASVLLLYLAMERLNVRREINFAFSLGYGLLIGPATYAMVILSENVCLFLLLAAGCLIAVATGRWRCGTSGSGPALLAGLAFGAAILVRPNVIFLWLAVALGLPLLAAGCLLTRKKIGDSGVFAHLTRPVLAGGALLLLPWLLIHYENDGVLSLTEMSDLARTSAAYNLFDRVHPQDRLLGEIMVKYYRQTNWPGHIERSYIWVALPEIGARSAAMPVPVRRGAESLRAYALYAYIGRVSEGLLWEHPLTWMTNSFADLARTFDFVFPQPDSSELKDPVALTLRPVVANLAGWHVVRGMIAVEAWMIATLYLLTFVALGVSVRRMQAAPDLPSRVVPLLVASLAAGTLACMIAPCVLATYDLRYSVPLIPYFVLCSAYLFPQGEQTKGAGAFAPAPNAPNPKV
jgi:hypothetical protein